MRELIEGLPFARKGEATPAGVYVMTMQGRPVLAVSRPGAVKAWAVRALHRVVFKAAFGHLPRSWVVHHVDHNKWNNEPGNLVAMPRWLHGKWHKLCRDAPAVRPSSEVATEWRAALTGVFLNLPREHRCRVWSSMVLQLPPWLAAEFGAVELSGRYVDRFPHMLSLVPEVQRFVRLYAVALACASRLPPSSC